MALSLALRHMMPGIMTGYKLSPSSGHLLNLIQSRGAARKGKRIERARQAKSRALQRRAKEAKLAMEQLRKKSVKIDKDQLRFQLERDLDRRLLPPPEDNVYFGERFRKKRYSFDEIIEFHRQAVHPTVFNQPDALVTATIELNLKMKLKKKRYIENINSTVCYPHLFTYQVRPRRIIALGKTPEQIEAAREAGAIQAGSTDIVALLKSKQLTERDFDHIVCHTDFLPDFAAVKGMKAQSYFPMKSRGNYGDDLAHLVKYFKDGLDYSLRKEPNDLSYGSIEAHFGRLNMTTDQLRENISALFDSINRFRPNNLVEGKQFFQRVFITTPATRETFVLRFWDLTDDYIDPEELEKEFELKAQAEAI